MSDKYKVLSDRFNAMPFEYRAIAADVDCTTRRNTLLIVRKKLKESIDNIIGPWLKNLERDMDKAVANPQPCAPKHSATVAQQPKPGSQKTLSQIASDLDGISDDDLVHQPSQVKKWLAISARQLRALA